MSKPNLSIEQRRTEIDLNIIAAVTLAILGVYMAFSSPVNAIFSNPEVPLLRRTALAALFQFGLAGLGITVVALYRRESFIKFGLTRVNLVQTILLSILPIIPYLVFCLTTGTLKSYLPFQSIKMTREWYALSFPSNLPGFALIAIAWGFFEGFNYVVISDKINQRYPSQNLWLNWGAIACGILCLLIHGMIGVTPSALMEALTVFIIIYGMLVVKQHTGNAWGCVLLFFFFWNAL